MCYLERDAADAAKEEFHGKELGGRVVEVAWGRPHVRPALPMFLHDKATGTCDANKALPIVRYGAYAR